jgi:hypothetical protein
MHLIRVVVTSLTLLSDDQVDLDPLAWPHAELHNECMSRVSLTPIIIQCNGAPRRQEWPAKKHKLVLIKVSIYLV